MHQSYIVEEKPSDMPRSLTRQSMTPLVVPFLLVFSTTIVSNYDYFHLVLQVSLIFLYILFFSILIALIWNIQWLGSCCNVNRCCPMSTGYPEKNFIIHDSCPLSAMERFHLMTRICRQLLATTECVRLWHRLLYRKGSKRNESVSHSSFFYLVLGLQIKPLIGEMIQYQLNFRCPSSDGHSFWQHKWDKHDMCSLSRFDQLFTS